MAELSVQDWGRSLAWYRDVLGLPVLMVDESRRFALLGSSGGRLALKQGGDPGSRQGVRLTFSVGDLDAERGRLVTLGVPVAAPVTDLREGFRSSRLEDPEGTPITLFEFDAEASSA